MIGPVVGRGRANSALVTVPLILALVAESAWLAALAGPLNAFAHHGPVLDPLSAIAFLVGGMALSRALGNRVGQRWPVVALTMSVLAAGIGVGLAPEARDAFVAGGVGGIFPALAVNPGGLLAGLALLRGISWGHTGLPVSEERLVRLLGGGSVAIVVAATIGALTLDPWRSAFLGTVLDYGLAFVGAATLALAFTRQALAAGGVAAGWQRNPIWVVTMLIVVLALGALAIGFSGQVRPAIDIVVGLLLVPLILIGLLVGWSKRGLRVFVIAIAVMVVLAGFSHAVMPGQQGQQGSSSSTADGPSPFDTAVSIGIGGGLAIVLVIVVLVLVRLWMSQSRNQHEAVIEERSIDRTPDTDARARRRRRLALTRGPTDAAGAYRALLADLEERNGVRREPWETPREHAGRLTGNADTGIGLNLLAADYALASFGNRHLSAAENGRAISRWRLLRRRLRAVTEAIGDDIPPPP